MNNAPQKMIVVHIVSLLVAVAGGILSIADTIKAIPNMPGWLANSWPVFLVAATLVDRVGKIIITYLDKIKGVDVVGALIAFLQHPVTIGAIHAYVAVSLVACSLTPDQKAKWGATGGFVARKVAVIAGKVILDSAVASLSGKEANWLDSAAAGVRTLPASITSEDIAEVVKIWTPAEKSEKWDKLGNAVADVAKQELERGTPPPKVAEGVAVGLNNAAAEARK